MEPNELEVGEEFEPKELPTRYVAVETYYYQPFDRDPTMMESKYGCELESGEQPYVRECKVGESWTPIDLGWLEGNVSRVVVRNLEGKFNYRNPTAAQKEEASKKVLNIALSDLGTGDNVILVPPQDSVKLYVRYPENLMVRSESGSIKFTVYVLPK